jgi:hypothetical protein
MKIWGLIVLLYCLGIGYSFTPRVVFKPMKGDDELEHLAKKKLVDMQCDPDFDIEEAEKIFAQVFPPSVCKTIKKRAIKEKIRLDISRNFI